MISLFVSVKEVKGILAPTVLIRMAQTFLSPKGILGIVWSMEGDADLLWSGPNSLYHYGYWGA